MIQEILAAITLVVFTSFLLISANVKFFRTYSNTKALEKKVNTGKPPSKNKSKKISGICPYTKDSSFVVEIAEDVAASPLEIFEDWINDNVLEENDEITNDMKPLAARWLNAGLSGQDVPGILRAGLKRLRDSKYFLVEDRHRLKYELSLKKKALDNPDRYPFVFVAEKDSLDAQRECLELFIDYLPRRYPDLYEYDKEKNSITVHMIDTTFLIEEYWNNNPLELCERIVQEDLILMRPEDKESESIQSYIMAAAAVVFSFNELAEKLGKPAEFIHAPVPGFEKYLKKTLNLTFSKLKPEKPLWRNNWGIAPNGTLDEPLYGSTDTHENRTFSEVSASEVKKKWLKVEYQTIRRLPRTGNLLFTVKTMADPMSSLESVPLAAACLAKSIRGMSPDMRKYKGIEDDETCQGVLSYLDSIQLDECKN